MDLNQLKTFLTVAEEKHLTRAAERLFTSQPAISAQLKALEEQLRLSLFERTPKGMELTLSGEKLLVQAKQILSSADDLLTQAKSLQGEIVAQLSIGVNSELSFLRIPQALAQSRAEHPMLELSFINSMSPNILSDVRKGLMDTGFFFGENTLGGLETIHLGDIPTAIVAPKAWQDKLDAANSQSVCELPWVYTTPRCPFYVLKEQFFAGIDAIPRDKAVFVDTEEAIKAMIKAEAGISLLREDDALRAVNEGWGVRWEAETPPCPLSVAVLASRLEEPAIKAWLTTIQGVWQRPKQTNLEAVI